LGHTPFGHAGEEVLDALYPHGFRHNEQSLRAVDVLEKDGKGLNLTWEVRDGILKHSKSRASIAAEAWGMAGTLEGQIVKIADSVAYINHDIADAVRAGVLREAQLPLKPITLLGNAHSLRIDAMVRDIIGSSWKTARAQESSIGQSAGEYQELRQGIEETARAGSPSITMSPPVLEAVDALREFLFQNVYIQTVEWDETEKAKQLLRMLYEHWCKHPEELPEEFKAACRTDSVERMVCDYVSGMTERFALKMFNQLYVPDFELG
jgi:dGTPase